MQSLIEQILPDIDYVVKSVTYDIEEQNELRQDLVLKVFDKKDQLKKAIKGDYLRGWLYRVSHNMYLDSKRGKDKNQRKQVRTTVLKNSILKEVEPTQHFQPCLKTLEQMLALLPYIERQWIIAWMDCDFNCSELERRTEEAGEKISRRHIKIRIDNILAKWKHLDIFLHS